MFPFAPGGSLENVWKNSPNEQAETWFLEQVSQLAECLTKIHEHDSGLTRHGDLKPDNILWFGTEVGTGHLKIADVGIAKTHQEITELRGTGTTARYSTVRYQPPEMEKNKQGTHRISRAFDVWSMGCILLEFLVWLLFGPEKLRNGRKGTFYDKTFGQYCCHKQTKTWVNELLDHPRMKDSLRKVLEFVSGRMLVVTVARDDAKPGRFRASRAKSAEFADRMRVILPSANQDRAQHQNTTSRRSNSSLPKLSLQTILSTSESTLSGADDNREIRALDRGRHELNDFWTFTTDDDLNQLLLGRGRFTLLPPILPGATSRSYLPTMNIWGPEAGIRYDIDELKKTSKTDELSKTLYQALMTATTVTRKTGKLVRVGPFFKSSSHVDSLPVISIYSDPGKGRHASMFNSSPELSLPSLVHKHQSSFAPLGLPRLPYPASTQQLSLFRSWLQICDELHGCVPWRSDDNWPKMPTRVIDVGDGQDNCLRVIDSGNKRAKYLALSHCWGQGLTFCTDQSNIAKHKKEMDYEQLPPTYKDAVMLTRALGVRYLWIDSICIIQGDTKDWDAEAGKMEHVYSCAYLTIAATSAASSAIGLFMPRLDRPVAAIKTPYSEKLYLCPCIDRFHEDVEKGILNTRGVLAMWRWRPLRDLSKDAQASPPFLSYALVSPNIESSPKSQLLGDSHFPKSILPYFRKDRQVLYQGLYEEYSRLSFSVPSDRSIAILGLERRLAQAFHTRAAYGVFERYLQRSLLWRRPDSGYITSIKYPAHRHVPSWSWMAYLGEITFIDAPFDGVQWSEENIRGPFETPPQMSPSYFKDHTPELIGYAICIDTKGLDGSSRLVFDRNSINDSVPLACVVLGEDKDSNTDRDLTLRPNASMWRRRTFSKLY
ncbi:Interleukin-1 receptor-associated kinase 4 [Seiridium cupressi]